MATKETIKKLMEDAGLYTKLYDLQIQEMAAAMDERKRMQSIVSREGRTIIKQGKNGDETIAHPLLTIINQFHRTIMQQMASLGLNRLKIDSAPNNKTKVQSFFDTLNDE